MKKVLLTSVLAASLMCAPIWATTIDLHAKPVEKSKVTTQVNAGTRLLPIYYPGKGQWLKVADPKNGNVGWVRFKDLNGASPVAGMHGVKYHQKIVTKSDNHGKGPQVYRVVEYSGTQKLKPKQVQELVQHMQMQSQRMQAQMQHMMQNMQASFNSMQPINPVMEGQGMMDMPMVQPVVVVSVPQSQQVISNAKTSQSETKSNWLNNLSQQVKSKS